MRAAALVLTILLPAVTHATRSLWSGQQLTQEGENRFLRVSARRHPLVASLRHELSASWGARYMAYMICHARA